jgi:hypothetical protein
MSSISTAFTIVLGVLFFVTLIEYITGAERKGMQMIFIIIIAFIIISILTSLR